MAVLPGRSFTVKFTTLEPVPPDPRGWVSQLPMDSSLASDTVLRGRAGAIFADGHTFSLGQSDKVDARLHFDWSGLGGENRPIFQLRLLSREVN